MTMTSTSQFTLRRIEVANFKRFVQAAFELRPLTLLVGLNGSGKSTLVQALLFGMRGLYARYDGFISLNQPGFPLGQAEDVFTLGEAQSERIEIGLTFADGNPPWPVVFERHPDPLRLAVKSGAANALVREQLRPSTGPEWVSYLSAERLGPRISLPVSAQGESAVYVGAQGELTADCLLSNLNHKVSPGRQFPAVSLDEDALITLPKQTEQWLNALVPGLQVKPIRLTEVLQSTIQFGTKALGTDWVRPTNMGFGVSYALPIIVQGLLMAPGGILIVENPEAHLHPAGQSAMGQFLARCAADGIQVILETHSDHVLNGICLAAIEDKHPLRREDVLIHNFLSEPKDGQYVEAIEIDKRGGFTKNPPGFFDQSAKDLQSILRARRPESATAKKLLERAQKAEE